MTAKELMPGMQLQTSRWGICTVLGLFRAGKWLLVEILDADGRDHVLSKFPNSLVENIRAEVDQP